MNTHRIQLKRSPSAVTVEKTTVTVEETHCSSPGSESDVQLQNSQSAPRQKSTSVARVIANPVDRPVTPLSRSDAVPVLSNASQAVVTAEQVGLGGIDPEEVDRLQQLLADAAEAVQELQAQHRQTLGEMQEVAVELAVSAASWLVSIAIDREMFAIDDLIMKSLEHLELSQPVQVRMNPSDYDLLQSLMNDPARPSRLDQLSYARDESLARGSLRVESGRRILLTNMSTRLEEIRRTWMENLDDSQIERRKDGSTPRSVRRFPERRETA